MTNIIFNEFRALINMRVVSLSIKHLVAIVNSVIIRYIYSVSRRCFLLYKFFYMIIESISIPTGVATFYEFERFVISKATTNATDWGITPAKLTALTPTQTVYEQFYKETTNRQTRSMAATAARDQAWGKLSVGVKDLYNTCLLYNEAISSEDKSALGIHIRDTVQQSAGRTPVSSPQVIFSSEEISILHIVVTDSNNPTSHAKPDGVGFLEIAGKIDVATAPPASVADCALRFHISRSHEPIEFDSTDRGKTLFAYSRWVTITGKNGPWSGMVSGIIP